MDEGQRNVPRWALPRSILVPLLIALFFAVVILVGTFWKSSSAPTHSALSVASGVKTESPATAASITNEVDSKEQKSGAQPVSTPPLQAVPVRAPGQEAAPAVTVRPPLSPILGIPPQWMMQAQVAHSGAQPSYGGDPQLMQALASLGRPGGNAGQVQPVAAAGYSVPHAAPVILTGSDGSNPFVVPDGAFNHADGPGYFVQEGTLLQCTLENDLNGQSDGPLWCDLTEPLISLSGRHTLIPVSDPNRPKVTRLEGESRRVEAFGQTRLGIFFKKLYMPDSYEVWFFDKENTQGLDDKGSAGVRGHVNNHIMSSFGVSLAIGLLGAAAELSTGSRVTERGAGRLEEGAAMGMSASSMQILSKFLNRMPTITVPRGKRIQVYLAANYQLPDYANHKMPDDF